MCHIIWTSDPDFEDWKDDLKENYPEYDDDELRDLMYEINNEYLEDEKINLNKELDRPILVVAGLGLWYGNRIGYKFLSGTNLNDIFSDTCGDFVEWYVEGKDIKCNDIHHDGTNVYTYYLLKSEYTKEDFEEYSWDHTVNEAVEMMTDHMGHFVAEIYGFDMEEKELV